MHSILHWLGIDDVSGKPYAFWSGVGGDLSIFAAPLVLLRRYNCHEKRCWRIGKHPVSGTPFTVCRKHHEDVP